MQDGESDEEQPRRHHVEQLLERVEAQILVVILQHQGDHSPNNGEKVNDDAVDGALQPKERNVVRHLHEKEERIGLEREGSE